jgi:hypothetical protein
MDDDLWMNDSSSLRLRSPLVDTLKARASAIFARPPPQSSPSSLSGSSQQDSTSTIPSMLESDQWLSPNAPHTSAHVATSVDQLSRLLGLQSPLATASESAALRSELRRLNRQLQATSEELRHLRDTHQPNTTNSHDTTSATHHDQQSLPSSTPIESRDDAIHSSQANHSQIEIGNDEEENKHEEEEEAMARHQSTIKRMERWRREADDATAAANELNRRLEQPPSINSDNDDEENHQLSHRVSQQHQQSQQHHHPRSQRSIPHQQQNQPLAWPPSSSAVPVVSRTAAPPISHDEPSMDELFAHKDALAREVEAALADAAASDDIYDPNNNNNHGDGNAVGQLENGIDEYDMDDMMRQDMSTPYVARSLLDAFEPTPASGLATTGAVPAATPSLSPNDFVMSDHLDDHGAFSNHSHDVGHETNDDENMAAFPQTLSAPAASARPTSSTIPSTARTRGVASVTSTRWHPPTAFAPNMAASHGESPHLPSSSTSQPKRSTASTSTIRPIPTSTRDRLLPVKVTDRVFLFNDDVDTKSGPILVPDDYETPQERRRKLHAL